MHPLRSEASRSGSILPIFKDLRGTGRPHKHDPGPPDTASRQLDSLASRERPLTTDNLWNRARQEAVPTRPQSLSEGPPARTSLIAGGKTARVSRSIPPRP